MTSPNEINDFFADCTDFELCDTLFVVIENTYGFDTLLEHAKHIPHERWVIHCLWGCMGFLDGEGYSYFWGSQLDHAGYAEALEEVGFDILANIIRDSIALVPPKILGDWDAVEAHTASETARDEAAEHMDEMFISDHPDYANDLGKYIRTRRQSFGDLLDAMKKQRQYIDDLRKNAAQLE